VETWKAVMKEVAERGLEETSKVVAEMGSEGTLKAVKAKAETG